MAESNTGGSKGTAKTTTRAKAATTAKAAKPRKAGAVKAAPAEPAASSAHATGTVAIREQVSATADTIRTEAQRKVTEIGDEVSRLYAQAGGRARDA
ncbi:MAG: hypothetical protein K2X31_03935, partial [Sphingopyxis sp.]|nr:hypothetical protein [Sphingopyxis sp.]